jgi:hypothetical protein
VQDAVSLARGVAAPGAWEHRLVEQQVSMRQLLPCSSAASGDPDDRALARTIASFVRTLPQPDSQRLALARELRGKQSENDGGRPVRDRNAEHCAVAVASDHSGATERLGGQVNYSGLMRWFYDWQTLLAGLAAVIAAAVTCVLIGRQIGQVERHERARLCGRRTPRGSPCRLFLASPPITLPLRRGRLPASSAASMATINNPGR